MENGINIDLDEIVNSYLSAWELPDSQFWRIHPIGVRALRKIYQHASASPIQVELPVLPNKTAIIPCDCLNYMDVGILNAKGEISPLTEDKNLNLGGSAEVRRTTQESEVPLLINRESEVFYDANGNFLTPFMYAQLGVGAQSDLGFYRMDMEQRVIVFDYQFGYSHVWLEYIPCLDTSNGKYMVNSFFSEAVFKFIESEDKRRSKSDRDTARFEFYNEFRLGRRALRHNEILQVFNSYNRTTRAARY